MQGFYRLKGTGRVGKFQGTKQVPDGKGGATEVVLLMCCGETSRRVMVALRDEVEAVRMDRYGEWIRKDTEQ